MTTKTQMKLGAVIGTALRDGSQWRLLLLWTAGVLIPTTVATLPVWMVLGAALDHSPRVAELAQHLDGLTLGDLLSVYGHTGAAINGGLVASVVVAILLSPLLSGLTIAAIRFEGQSGGGLDFTALMRGAAEVYGRLLRLLLLALALTVVVLLIVSGLFKANHERTLRMVLESRAHYATYIVRLAALLIALLVHATVEAGRARLAVEPERRSAFRAWCSGVRLLFTRPLTTLALYVVPTLVGVAVAAVLGLMRVRLDSIGFGSFLFAFLVTQLGAAAMGWSRASRLFALAALARQVR